jgi:hypothetical protein
MIKEPTRRPIFNIVILPVMVKEPTRRPIFNNHDR